MKNGNQNQHQQNSDNKTNNESVEPFVPVKEGLYRAKLVKTKNVESKESKRPMIQFTWELQDQPYGGKKLNSYIVTDDSKALYVLDLMAQCLLGKDYDEAGFDAENDLDLLHRKECMLQIEKNDINGKTFNNVRRYYPLSRTV